MRKIDRSIVMLASFPRSGNTWMRFILANLFKKDDSQVNFKNIRDYMPTGYNDDLETTNRLIRKGYPFVIKEHKSYYNKNVVPKKVIYITRKKIDVLKSYWFFLSREDPNLFTKIEDFVKCYRYKYGSWEEHVESWKSGIDNDAQLLDIHYEDMTTDVVGVIQKCMDYMNLKTTKQEIEEAVNKCTYDKMKNMEKSKVNDVSYKKTMSTLVDLAHKLRGAPNSVSDYYRYVFMRLRSKIMRIGNL